MSDEIRANISAMAKALCHYPSGPSNVNSCCPGIGRCEMDAAIAEVSRLRAALTTARREGLEEAAKITLKLRDEWRNPEQRGGVAYAEAIAVAIRAAAKEGKMSDDLVKSLEWSCRDPVTHEPIDDGDYSNATVSEVKQAIAEITRFRAELAAARREGMEMPPEFLEWVKREMPSGTHIHNPEWWASRVWKAAIRAAAKEGKS